jgi:hypothetical protein
MVRVQFRPKLVLLDIIQVLTRRKIALPSYAVLATLVIAAVTHHQRALSRIIDDSLTDSQRTRLDALLEKEPETGAANGWRYRLTLLKKPDQSTQPSKIKANLADLGTLRALYLDLKPVVDRLALSFEGIRYYAYSVIRFQIPQMSRRSAEDRHLHLISFIVYQTFKLQDILIDTLLSTGPSMRPRRSIKSRITRSGRSETARFPSSSTGSGTVSWGLYRQSRASWSTSG